MDVGVIRARDFDGYEAFALTHPKVLCYAEAELQRCAQVGKQIAPGLVLLRTVNLSDSPAFRFVHSIHRIERAVSATTLDDVLQRMFEAWSRYDRFLSTAHCPPIFLVDDVPFDRDKARHKSLVLARTELQKAVRLKYAGQRHKHGLAGSQEDPQPMCAWLMEPWSALVTHVLWQRQSVSPQSSQSVYDAIGRPNIELTKRAPSRAYRKLSEAMRWLNCSFSAGDHIVDCGGAPGGWSYIALEHGAQVTLIDRGQVDDVLYQYPLFQWKKEDAFCCDMPSNMTWLLSDIIDRPDRLLVLCEKTILAHPDLKGGVITFKFQPNDTNTYVHNMITRAEILTASHGYQAHFRHLYYNKGEMTFAFMKASG